MPTWFRTLVLGVLALSLGVSVGGPADAASPSSRGPDGAAATAAPDPGSYPVVLSGDFTGDWVNDLFFYSPSSAPDVLYDFNPTTSGGPPLDIWTYDVRGTYRPVVGRFTGGEFVDDILWYAPGAKADVIWAFDGCFSGCTSRPPYHRVPVTINGTYTPVAGHFFPGDGDDVLWYGRGGISDSIWDFRTSCAMCAASYTSRPVTVNGSSYEPVAGNFVGQGGIIDDVFWYNPAGAESLWVFSSPFDYRYTSISPSAIQVRGTSYELAVADLFDDEADDIVFVGPGAAQDSVWDFYGDAVYKIGAPEPLDGHYTAVTGVVGPYHQDEPDDFFVYDPTATAGRYFDIGYGGTPTSFIYSRYDFEPAPVTETTPVGVAASAKPTPMPWWSTPRRG